MVANLITLARVALLFVGIAMLYSSSYTVVLFAVGLLLIVFVGDAVDGIVARRSGQATAFGAILDIAGDRVVENALWIVFADLGLIGVWAPLLVVTRGFLVDALRSVALNQGKTPFGEQTMARTTLTRFLTASRFMRALYGVAKLLAFAFLSGLVAARHAPSDNDPLHALYTVAGFTTVGWVTVYVTLALVVVRGLPVLVDALPYIQHINRADPPQSENPAASTRLR